MLGDDSLKLDTTSIEEFMPLLKQKVGPDVPLLFELKPAGPEIELRDEFDADEIYAEFGLWMKIFDNRDPENPQELLYD